MGCVIHSSADVRKPGDRNGCAWHDNAMRKTLLLFSLLAALFHLCAFVGHDQDPDPQCCVHAHNALPAGGCPDDCPMTGCSGSAVGTPTAGACKKGIDQQTCATGTTVSMKSYRWYCEPAVCATNPTKWGCDWKQQNVEPGTTSQTLAECNGDPCPYDRDKRVPN
jgi:hypothetical protein